MNIDERHVCARCLSPVTEGTRCELCGFLESEYIPEPHHLPPETLLQRRYLVASVLGEGGFGVTYAAWDLTLDRAVAVKEYFPRFTAERDCGKTYAVSPLSGGSSKNWFAAGRDRFLREARILATLSGIRGIVPALDCFEENDTAYIVMDFIRGVSLRRLADQFGGKLPASELLPMLRPVLDALILVHRSGLLHRDISPDNILIDREGTAWLIDFGAAEEANRGLDDVSRTILLRKGYTPLEQYDSHGEQGAWTDVYALSATIYDLLCGQAPPEAVLRAGRDSLVPPNKLGAHLSHRQQRALTRGLAVHVSPRISSMELLRSRLYNLPLPEEVRWKKRLIRNIAAVSAAVVLVGGLFVLNATTGLPTFSGVCFTVTSDGISAARYIGGKSSFSIPDSLLGLNVSEIASRAFADQDSLVSVRLPETIRTIGTMAFSGCVKLTAVNIPQGTSLIDDYAFLGCKTLSSVTLPSSVTSIAENAFEGCSDSLTLYGESGSYAEQYASDNGIKFAVSSEFRYYVINGGAVITGYRGSASDVVVPAELGGCPVRRIDDAVFMFNYDLRSIELPDTLRSIGDSAFGNAYHLKSIRFPEGFLTIEGNAFWSCFALESVELPSTLRTIGEDAFSLCWTLSSIVIPNGVTELSSGVFIDCDRLESVTLPNTLISIGSFAFRNCTKLTHLRLPDSVRSIGEYAFSDCSSFRTLYIPEETQVIDLYAFGGEPDKPLVNTCPKLTVIGKPNSAAETIAEACGLKFDDVAKWEPVESFEYYFDNGGVSITNYHGKSTDLIMPTYIDGLPVLRIGEQVFDSNTTIRSVVLPLRLEQIDSNAFSGCYNLKEIDLPDGLKTIGDHAFYSCAIETLNLPNSLTSLGLQAFLDNTSLKSLTIGSGLVYWHFYDFDGADVLENLTIESAASVDYCIFFQLHSLRLGSGVRRIESGAFSSCPLLTFVYIPANVTSIADDAFTVTDQLVIHGSAGSAAEAYALKNGVRFIAEP